MGFCGGLRPPQNPFFSPFPLPLTFGGGRGEGPEVRALGRLFNERKKCKPVFPAN